MVRAVSGGLPHIHQRILSNKRALAKILSMGLSRRHRANPVAALQAETIFATPIHISGIASLILSKREKSILAQHVEATTAKNS